MLIFDPLYLLYVSPAIILALWAQARVSSTFARYSKVSSLSGYSGADAARRIMSHAGLNVGVEAVPGRLTDHYDPRSKLLRLSEPVYGGRSLAALGVAAHEAGHAIQDGAGYMPMKLRHGIFPVVALGSRAWSLLFILGLFMGGMRGAPLGSTLMTAATILLGAVVVFQIVTLPVELNASKRALALLTSEGILTRDEVDGARKVLTAAALTYIAAALQGVLTLLYLLSRRR